MTAPITPDERAAMRALTDAATPGPWEAHEGTVGAMTGPRGCGGCSGLVSPRHEPACFWSEVAGAAPADAAFIAAARTDVPRLLDALDTAEAEVARLRDQAAPVWDEDTVTEAVARTLWAHGTGGAAYLVADLARMWDEGTFPRDPETQHSVRVVHAQAAAVLAVVWEHLPVRLEQKEKRP